MAEKHFPTAGLFDVATAVEESAMNLAIGAQMLLDELQELEIADREELAAARNRLHFIARGIKSIGAGLEEISDQAYDLSGKTTDDSAPGSKHPPTIKVGDLRRDLQCYPDDFDLSFSGLEFFRVKTRGENLAQVEFNQLVYLDKHGQVDVENT